MDSFVAGRHRYLVPVSTDEPAVARGLLGRDWPNAVEVPTDRLRDQDIDLVVVQRPEEIELAERWLGRRLGPDVPTVYVEHNAPRPFAVDSVHPIADRHDIPLIHVTEFNELMWDNGAAPTMVINHGVADPGRLYTGEIPAAAAMINEPLRRWRTVGADLLGELAAHRPIDVWGIDTLALNDRHPNGLVRGRGDVSPPQLWREVARRRVYLHTARWTSLGLSMVEAMFLGMPIVAVATTMAPLVVPTEAGVVSANPKTLAYALERFATDFADAGAAGKAARDFAVANFSLDRFLTQWDEVIDGLCR
ncbi:glycosyltransferase [Mycolicibacterium thermoresistibile]